MKYYGIKEGSGQYDKVVAVSPFYGDACTIAKAFVVDGKLTGSKSVADYIVELPVLICLGEE